MYKLGPDMDEPGIAQPEQPMLRYIMPQEMESLLAYNGYKPLSRYGDWAGPPLTEESDLQIYLCTSAETQRINSPQ